MAPIHVLITGANRGLGMELAKRFLAQPEHVVITAVRDPAHPTAKNLASLPKGEGSKLVVVKYDAAVEQSPFDVVTTIKGEHGVDKLDLVVANAGIAKAFGSVAEIKRVDVLEHVTVNTFGIVSLYQATRGLLQEAYEKQSQSTGKKPVFALLGSGAGSLSEQPNVPNAAYGPSKSMVHWYGVRINTENDWLSAPIIDPGWTQTDMGNFGAKIFGVDEAPVKVEDSVIGMFEILTDPESKEKYGGKFVEYTKKIHNW